VYAVAWHPDDEATGEPVVWSREGPVYYVDVPPPAMLSTCNVRTVWLRDSLPCHCLARQETSSPSN
jgi:hypothetical protein